MRENGYEHGHQLQASKKIDAASDDIVRQIFAAKCGSNQVKDCAPQFDDSNNHGSCDTFQINNTDRKDETSNVKQKAHFVEIGEFSCGSIFGLGEQMDDRIIIAKHTEVQCLLIPHYWLLQKKQNAGNIWQR